MAYNGFVNGNGPQNAQMKMTDNGSTITRNVADANPALVVEQKNPDSIGNIADFVFDGILLASISKDGVIHTESYVSTQDLYSGRVFANSLMGNWGKDYGEIIPGGNPETAFKISRNTPDALPTLVVDNINPDSTGNLQEWHTAGSLKAWVDKNGFLGAVGYLDFGDGLRCNYGAEYGVFNTGRDNMGNTMYRRVADNYAALTVNQAHPDATGDILDLKVDSVSMLTVSVDGVLHCKSIETIDPLPAAEIAGCQCSVDFGAQDDMAMAVVTGQTWVKTTSKIVASLVAEENPPYRSLEDGIIEGIVLSIGALIPGVGFTVLAGAPNGANGIYKIMCIGG